VPTPNNLPAELSSFVGREPQLAELRRLLRRSRLITLTGPGGAGKTRLALHLAAGILNHYPDGVWLVELASLADARLLDQTVATACRITEKSKRPLVEALLEGLGTRRVLLVLDGCEHMVDPCASLTTRLLRSCPKLTILVTSREPLGVSGELIWRTPSLSVPAPEDASRPELVLASEAVRLYVERAQLVRPDFQLDDSVSAPVAQICARLEGIPLAIELAASLARVMTTKEILERLRDRFRLLTGGSRNALPRHQTLRQAVDWSYGLLGPAEKALLARLSVFAGGFDLAAAEAVAQEEPLDPGGVLPILSRLVDKSLVSAEAADSSSTRFRMLDTIREYALEKLQHGDEADARRRHARYFVEFSGRAAKGLRGSDSMPWLERLDEEQANVRLALGWALTEQPDDALRLAAAMGIYWHMRRHFAEGTEWLDQTLDLATPSLDARAAALWSRARIRWRSGEYAGAKRDATECVELSRRLELPAELSGALTMLGLVCGAEDDVESAERFIEEALQISRRLKDPEGIARGLNNLALFASQRGDHESARKALEQAWAEIKTGGIRATTANILDSLGRVNLLLGDRPAARRHYEESMQLSTRFEDSINLAECLEGIALLAEADGDASRTIRLIAGANSIRVATGAQAMPDWRSKVNEGLISARAKLGSRLADAEWQYGAAMNVQEAVRYASGAAAAPIRVDGSPLTGRETQVAALIADGMTNPEIAKRLRMADRTADAHVEHIRNKLGLRSRSQIAVWAHERLGKA
jgi:predicted ATPase/DNA-binding CsgD family transcriptional regulator